ncbi:hypothetical protein B0H11DRAFT_2389147 [Mycena galericulata]|nr:hypothetical protein B0H11DRAFT_2389147 [Mycena galericulata]
MLKNLARASIRFLSRPGVLASRQIHGTSVAFKNHNSQVVVDVIFDDEEQWDVVEDLIPTCPTPKTPSPSSSSIVASKSASISSVSSEAAKIDDRRLSPGHRLHKFNALVKFKEGHLKTKGKARIGPGGQPKCAHLFSEITSEHFARRCEELGIPEHALAVYGAFVTYVLPLTLAAARRLLHILVAAERTLADIVTTTACYPSYGLPLANEGLPSCALLLSACLRHLKTTEEGKQRKEAEALIAGLVSALERIAATPPIPASRDVRDKTVRGWLKGVMRDVDELLRGKEQSRGWLEDTVREPTRSPLPEASTSASAFKTRTASPTTVGRAQFSRIANCTSAGGVSTPSPAATLSTRHLDSGAPQVPPPVTPAVHAHRATATAVPEPPVAATPAPPRTRDRDDREERHHHWGFQAVGPARPKDWE